MTRFKTLPAAMAAFLAVGGIASVAGLPATVFAAEEKTSDGKDDAGEFDKLNNAKVTLGAAIAAAEAAHGGKAVNAALDNEQANATYEIEVMTADGSHNVAVDGMTGKVSADTGNSDGDSEQE